MDRQIKIRITADGRVEIDSTIYKDCKDVADHLTKVLGEIESFTEKDAVFEREIKLKVDSD
ncbi:MAG: hypothetical protein A2X93_05255 [Deltaproteobacteria bacterium GWC2_56_8]|nr:MAG: hypothetical protein A2X99_11720 [Deltaproteobacteria bacterium GWB2_55_19]OGP38679.1 MAG: hypothetical protein A2X93_05255 [Deltaproteobacteria bacterium GWC2_56_8]HAO94313.1 hypothetical protein [Deltaproteobacteria bacterium]